MLQWAKISKKKISAIKFFAQFLIFQPIVDGHFRHGEYKSLASVSHMISAKRKSLGETWVFFGKPINFLFFIADAGLFHLLKILFRRHSWSCSKKKSHQENISKMFFLILKKNF
jgi:hypothetical protein